MDSGGLLGLLAIVYVGMYVRHVWLALTGVSGRSATQNATVASPPEFQADVTAVAADVVGRTSSDLYREAMHLVLPFLQGHALRLDPECFGRGLALLEHVVRMEPTEWRPLWALGMSYRRTESHVRSYECLKRAYELAPNESPTVVEYVRACLWLGRTQEALMPAKHEVDLSGGSADARSNLALTFLLYGDLDSADAEAAAAAELAPDDQMISRLREIIADVRDGRRLRPRSLRDIEKPPASAPPDGLTPQEAQRAFEEAFTDYRVLLEADPARVLSPEEWNDLEPRTGPIRHIEVRATAVDLTWRGRTLIPSLTERTVLAGSKGAFVREARLQMQIEARPEGWRVIQAFLLPALSGSTSPGRTSHTNS